MNPRLLGNLGPCSYQVCRPPRYSCEGGDGPLAPNPINPITAKIPLNPTNHINPINPINPKKPRATALAACKFGIISGRRAFSRMPSSALLPFLGGFRFPQNPGSKHGHSWKQFSVFGALRGQRPTPPARMQKNIAKSPLRTSSGSRRPFLSTRSFRGAFN